MKPLSEREERTLGALTALARETEAEALDDTDARRMIRQATLGARARGARRRQRWVMATSAATAAALAALVTLAWVTSGDSAGQAAAPPAAPESAAGETVPAHADPMELALPSGDRITAVEGSRFELLSMTDTERRVSLSRGAMLFDVARLGDGATFEVETRDLRVRVLGTIFSVDAREDGTTVRVYEGRVEVLRDGEAGAAPRLLTQGESWSSGTDFGPDARLSARGRRAAEARASVAPRPEEAAPAEPVVALAEPAVTAPIPTPRRESPPTVERAQAMIAAGNPEAALLAARRALAERPGDLAYRLVEADALRALRRFAEAAPVYDRVAVSPGAAHVGAGFRAASIRFADLSDPAGALASLDAASVDGEGSPFEERGLALRARALEALGRRADTRAVAERYLARFPAGTTRADMTRLASDVP